jgi:CPA1 family monovalent cation:H+ antiporter
LNGFIFIVIGLQLPEILRALSHEPFMRLVRYALLISATVVLVRIVWVFPGTYLPGWLSRKWRAHEPRPPWRHMLLVAWAGMRGVVSLAAAFSLPLVLDDGRPFPGRSYILFLTFCVILTTLVFQGLTLPILIKKLGIQDDGAADREERDARLRANEAAVDFIEQRALEQHLPEEVMVRVRAEYCDRIAQLEAAAGQTNNPGGEVATPTYQRLQFGALGVERQTIIALRNSDQINDEALRHIQRDLDLAEARLTGD